jgi:ActR/RegA family two-component response regulator
MAAQITSVARAPGSMSVLVVDDCEPFLVPFGRALAEQGMVVQTAGSFAQAARIIGSVGLPTFLVSELRVCSHALLDFMKDVKDTLPADRFVVATRYPSIATAVHFTRIGVAGYLTKPIFVADLLEIIKEQRLAAEVAPNSPDQLPWPTLDRAIWEYLSRVHAAAGSVSEAARRLGVDRRSLRRMLGKFPPLR